MLRFLMRYKVNRIRYIIYFGSTHLSVTLIIEPLVDAKKYMNIKKIGSKNNYMKNIILI